MKICPTCRRTYPDGGPNFCPDDRSSLYGGGAAVNPQPPNFFPPGSAPPQYTPPEGKRKGMAVAALILSLVRK